MYIVHFAEYEIELSKDNVEFFVSTLFFVFYSTLQLKYSIGITVSAASWGHEEREFTDAISHTFDGLQEKSLDRFFLRKVSRSCSTM